MALQAALPILGLRTYLRGFEMSVDMPPDENTEKSLLPLRREALLPNERGRGLGTVAVVCTMAGVASGLALATTLMAMQVADSMSVRTCPYRVVTTEIVQPVADTRSEHGFLGIRYGFHDGFADIDRVIAGTPAAAIGLHRGDHLLAIDGIKVRSSDDLQERIYGAHPGSTPVLLVEHANGANENVTPTLATWPVASY
jgi:S1-C subfamily serine protease